MQASTLLASLALIATLFTAPMFANEAGADDAIAVSIQRLEPDRVRADLDVLYRQLRESHFDLYARRSRTDYDVLYSNLRASISEDMDLAQARLLYQRFVAYGNVAHARVDLPWERWEDFRASGGKAFPLYLRVEQGRVFVSANASALEQIRIGDEVLAIDGEKPLSWLAPARALVSADNEHLAWTQAEGMLPALVWFGRGEIGALAVKLGRDGQHFELRMEPRDRSGFEDAMRTRVGLFEPDPNARIARITEDGIAYLRPGPFYDNRADAPSPWDATEFHRFIDAAFESFQDKRATRLLIDLRDNPGGDHSFSDRMIAWFAGRPFRFASRFDVRVSEAAIANNRKRLQPAGDSPGSLTRWLDEAYAKRKPGEVIAMDLPLSQPMPEPRYAGEVWLLINRRSYSNTANVAALVQDYGFGTVLGEETADLASTYGAAEQFTLPATGIEVHFPKAHIVRPNGDTQPRGVIPDHPIPAPLRASREDTVLAEALRWVAMQPDRTARRQEDVQATSVRRE